MRPRNKVAVGGSGATDVTFYYVEVPGLEEALSKIENLEGSTVMEPQVRLPMRRHAHYNAVTPQPPLSYAKSCSYNP